MSTEEKYGPQTEQVEALIIKIRSLTDEQRDALHETSREWDTIIARWKWDADYHVALRLSSCRTQDLMLDEAWETIPDMEWDEIWIAVWALVIRDQIGDEFTQKHYDLLTTPWRTTIGSIHPDDADLNI